MNTKTNEKRREPKPCLGAISELQLKCVVPSLVSRNATSRGSKHPRSTAAAECRAQCRRAVRMVGARCSASRLIIAIAVEWIVPITTGRLDHHGRSSRRRPAAVAEKAQHARSSAVKRRFINTCSDRQTAMQHRTHARPTLVFDAAALQAPNHPPSIAYYRIDLSI